MTKDIRGDLEGDSGGRSVRVIDERGGSRGLVAAIVGMLRRSREYANVTSLFVV
jgi:hypothetical protein